MLTAYLDESMDGAQKRVFLLAGYVGHNDNWDRLWTKWARLLKILRLSEFHAGDCEKGRKDFAGMSPRRRGAIQRKFVNLLADKTNGLFGHICAIKLDDYLPLRSQFMEARRIPPGGEISGSLGEPYFLGMQHVVERVVRSDAVSALPPDMRIDFVFDASSFAGRARSVFEKVKNDAGLGEWTRRIGNAQFCSSADYPPLQAADLLSYEALHYSDQHFSQTGTVKRWQFTELEKHIDWKSASYFSETGLRKILEILKGQRAPIRDVTSPV